VHAALDSVQDDSPAASDVVVVVFGHEEKDFFLIFSLLRKTSCNNYLLYCAFIIVALSLLPFLCRILKNTTSYYLPSTYFPFPTHPIRLLITFSENNF
jgi:hypothetical protein